MPLGLGTWQWGDGTYWGWGRDYGWSDVQAAYESARAAGTTLFDTAESYGRGTSERLLGRLIAEHGDANQVEVATKFAPLPWRAWRRGPLLAALESSLARLGLPRVALYQIHFPLPVLGDRAWLLDLADAVRQGLIGAVGVSNYGPAHLRAAHRVLAAEGVPLVTNQVQYSLLHRSVEQNGVMEVCRELDVRVIAWSPLAQGLLTGRFGPDHPPPGVRGLRYRRLLPRLEPLLHELGSIASGRGRTPSQVALNWLIAQGAVPIPGARSAQQAHDNAGAAGWSLTAAEVSRLDGLTRARARRG